MPGTYTVTVSVKPYDTAVNYAVGGTKTFTVKVVRGTVDADANVYVYLKSSGKVITSFSKEYDGDAVSVRLQPHLRSQGFRRRQRRD